MKRFLATAVFLLPALFACTEDPEAGNKVATSVVLSTDKIEMQVGGSATLTATVLPAALNMGVNWTVIDEDLVEVQDGTVLGKSEGVTYVIATSTDGYQKAACMVTVNPPIKYGVSLRDEYGEPLSALYGYPGKTQQVVAVTTDGDAGHSFTWSVDDNAAGTVTSDGVLTFGTVASAGDDYAYDAQSYLKVVSEDGYGCKIPVRSSMLRGLSIDGEYYIAGSTVKVQKEGHYLIAVLYAGAETPEEIPSEAVSFELSNATDFSISQVGSLYNLNTGEETNVTSSLSATLRGTTDKVEVARLKIDRIWPVKASLAAKSSSTLTYTWTEGVSDADDAAKPYTITLYKDEAGTDEVVSYSIPAGSSCWKGNRPRFVFSGLKPSTSYWLKVIDTDGEEGVESDLIGATTSPFNIVEPSSVEATVGDVILAEDFGEMLWGADETSGAAGYDVAEEGLAYNTDTGLSFSCREAARFVATTGQYAQRSLTAQSKAKKEAGVRIAKWAQGQYARIYIGPGYLFLSTKSYGTHIITPSLDNIPEGKTATVKVTVHAAGYASGYEAAFAVQHEKSFYLVGSGNQTNKNTLDLESNVATITYKGGISQVDEFSVTLTGLVKGDRIAFGPTSEKTQANSNMMLISDMTVQIEDLN